MPHPNSSEVHVSAYYADTCTSEEHIMLIHVPQKSSILHVIDDCHGINNSCMFKKHINGNRNPSARASKLFANNSGTAHCNIMKEASKEEQRSGQLDIS